MSKPKWMPGPAHVVDHVDQANHGRRVVADGRVVADCSCLDPPVNQANATLFATATDLYESLQPLAATRIDSDTASDIEAAIILSTGDGELAAHVSKLLTDGASEARRVSNKARGEEAPK